MEDYNTEIKVEHKQSESQRAMNSMQVQRCDVKR